MRLLQLGLRNYRNYRWLDLEPNPHLNLFLGRNGQGKTNLLESISVLALSSSPRARRESELVGPLAAESRIEAVVQAASRQVEIEITVRVEAEVGRRTIRVDGQPRRAYDLPGLFRATLFWPDDLNLVKSGPEHRRRFLNQLLVQVEPGYARALSGYRRVVEQRNHLLKQVALGQQPATGLDVWDLELTRIGSQLTQARSLAIADLGPMAARKHGQISGGESLELGYEGPPQNFLEAVQNSRPEDIRRGSTGLGPHRDDVTVTLDGREARSFASQGQQRTAVVSLKLAEAALIEARTGEPPVLLLDDVLSELDGDRRQALLTGLGSGGQVVITSVESSPFSDELVEQARVMCIDNGAVVACG